jgi:hypothetical protein
MVDALLASQNKTKPSIQKVVVSFFIEFLVAMHGHTRTVLKSEQVRKLAQDLIAQEPKSEKMRKWHELVQTYVASECEYTHAQREGMIRHLTELLLNNAFNMTTQAIAIQLLNLLQLPDTHSIEEAAKVAIKFSVSELPPARTASTDMLVRLFVLLKGHRKASNGHPLKRTLILPSPLPADFSEQYAAKAFDMDALDQW